MADLPRSVHAVNLVEREAMKINFKMKMIQKKIIVFRLKKSYLLPEESNAEILQWY